ALKERLAHLGRADVVVAVPGIATHDALLDTISRVRGALDGAVPAPRAVLIHPDGAVPDPGPAEAQPALLPFPLTAVNRLPGPGGRSPASGTPRTPTRRWRSCSARCSRTSSGTPPAGRRSGARRRCRRSARPGRCSTKPARWR